MKDIITVEAIRKYLFITSMRGYNTCRKAVFPGHCHCNFLLTSEQHNGGVLQDILTNTDEKTSIRVNDSLDNYGQSLEATKPQFISQAI